MAQRPNARRWILIGCVLAIGLVAVGVFGSAPKREKTKLATSTVEVNDLNRLFAAISRGSLLDVQACTRSGRCINLRDRETSWTPLMLACSQESTDRSVVASLLFSGADPDVAADDGMTPLMLASVAGSPGVVQALVTFGAKVDARTPDGLTALMFAAMAGHEEVVLILVTNGYADTSIKDARGSTAEELAWLRGKDHCARIIRAAR